MRLLNVFIDFLRVFLLIKRKHSKINYSSKVKNFSSSKSQLIEQKFILKQINLFKKKKILDYGCNNCSFNFFLNKNFLYCGVDSNARILTEKIKKYSKNFKLIKNNKMPFKKKTFDCVLLSHVIGHIENTNTLLKNLYRVLSVNGIIIIVTPNKHYKFFYFFKNIFNQYQPDETILKYYSLRNVIKTFEKNNFEIVKSCKYSIKRNKIIPSYLNSRILVIVKKRAI